jgi:hypothetical protein
MSELPEYLPTPFEGGTIIVGDFTNRNRQRDETKSADEGYPISGNIVEFLTAVEELQVRQGRVFQVAEDLGSVLRADMDGLILPSWGEVQAAASQWAQDVLDQ